MRCDICGKLTSWDSSYGRRTFIVCPTCHQKLVERIKKLRELNFSPECSALELILIIGCIKEGIEK